MIRVLAVVLLAGLCACQRPTLPPGDAVASVYGQVAGSDDTPVAGAFVYAYLSNRNSLRGPADYAARVDADGSYLLELPAGRYYLICRWRASGSTSGPPRSGDAMALPAGNPVTIAGGVRHRVDFSLQTVGQQQSLRQGSLTSGDTGIRGRLIDAEGRPVAGAFVLAYSSPDYRRSPDWTSLPADDSGQFLLYLPGAGRYCLAARTGSRSQPREGEPYGRLGDGDDGCRTLEQGAMLDIGTLVLHPYRR